MISFIRALFGGDGPKSGHYVLYSFQFIYAEIGYSDRAVYSDMNLGPRLESCHEFFYIIHLGPLSLHK